MYVPTALPPSIEEGMRRRPDRLLAACFLVSLVFHVALGGLLMCLRWSRPVPPPRFTEVRLIHRAPSGPLRAPRRLPAAPRVAARPKNLSLYLHDGRSAPPRRRSRRGRRSRAAQMLASRPVAEPGDLGAGGDGAAPAPTAGPISAGGGAASVAPPVPGGEHPGRRGRARRVGEGSAPHRVRSVTRPARARSSAGSRRLLAAVPPSVTPPSPSPAEPDPLRAAPGLRSAQERPQPIRLARRPSLRADERLPAQKDAEPDVPMAPARRTETEPVARRGEAPSADDRLARLPEHLPSQDAGPQVVTGPESAPDHVATPAEPSPVRVSPRREARREPEIDPRVSSGRGAAADETLPGPALASAAPDEQPGNRDAFRARPRESASHRDRSTPRTTGGRKDGGHVPDLSGEDARESGPAGRGAASPDGSGGAARKQGDAEAEGDGGAQRFGRRAGGRAGGDSPAGTGDQDAGPGKARRSDGAGDDDGEGDLGLPGGGGRGEGDGGPGGDTGGPGGAGGRGLPAKPEAGGVYVSTTGRYLLPGAVTGSDYMFHVNALNKILDEINSRTRLRVRLGRQYLRIRPGGFGRAPVVVFTGHRAFTLNDEQRLALRQYVEGGGMIWADLSNAPFDDSFRDEMERIFGRRPTPLGSGHTIYRSFYVLNGIPQGDLGGAAPFEGIAIGDRLGVVITPNRYFGAVSGPPHVTEEVQEGAFRVAVNIYVYAAAHYRAGQDE